MALLRCSVMSSIGGSQLAFLTITDGQSTNYAAPPADTRRVCACTFYLVFKEPEVVSPLRRQPSSGEPFNLTNAWRLCQPPPSLFYRRAGPLQPSSPTIADLRRALSPGDGRAEKACFSRCPADRAEPTQYTIRRGSCQPRRISRQRRGASRRFVGGKVSIEIKISEIKHSRSH
jgi:hypothetical protein